MSKQEEIKKSQVLLTTTLTNSDCLNDYILLVVKEPYERTEERTGSRNGFRACPLTTRNKDVAEGARNKGEPRTKHSHPLKFNSMSLHISIRSFCSHNPAVHEKYYPQRLSLLQSDITKSIYVT